MISWSGLLGYLKKLITGNYYGIITIKMQHGSISEIKNEETFKKDEEMI